MYTLPTTSKSVREVSETADVGHVPKLGTALARRTLSSRVRGGRPGMKTFVCGVGGVLSLCCVLCACVCVVCLCLCLCKCVSLQAVAWPRKGFVSGASNNSWDPKKAPPSLLDGKPPTSRSLVLAAVHLLRPRSRSSFRRDAAHPLALFAGAPWRRDAVPDAPRVGRNGVC